MRDKRGRSAARSAIVLAVCLAVVQVTGCSSDDSGAKDAKGAKEGSAASSSTTKVPTTKQTVPDSPGKAIAMPDLSEEKASAATKTLRDEGFQNITAIDATGKGRIVDVEDPWIVVGQAVPAGSSVGSNEPTTVFVTKPGETAKPPGKLGYVQVPDLLYRPVKDSVAMLNAMGIFDLVGEDFSGKGRLIEVDKPWTVLSQRPVAGTWVMPSDRFTFSALPAAEAPKHSN